MKQSKKKRAPAARSNKTPSPRTAKAGAVKRESRKSIAVRNALRILLKEVDPNDPEGLAKLIAEQLIHLAIKGRDGDIRIRAIQQIFNLTEG